MNATTAQLRAELERATAARERITRMTLQRGPVVAAMRAAEDARDALDAHLRSIGAQS